MVKYTIINPVVYFLINWHIDSLRTMLPMRYQPDNHTEQREEEMHEKFGKGVIADEDLAIHYHP